MIQNILLTSAICFILTLGAKAQCVATADDPCIPTHQSTLNRVAKALDESKAKDDLIAAYKALGTLTDAERAAFQNALKATQDAFDARGKVIADMDHINALQQKVIEMYSVLVEKLTAKLNAPRSAWQKFLAVMEKVLYIAAGVSLGRGL